MGRRAVGGVGRNCVIVPTDAAKHREQFVPIPKRDIATTSRRAPTAAADDPRRDGNPLKAEHCKLTDYRTQQNSTYVARL